MKTAFASILLACCCLSAPALAETSHSDFACEAATGQARDDCNALRVAYLDRVSACMAQRKEMADLAVGSSHENGPHTNRARHLLCTAEVQAGMGIASK